MAQARPAHSMTTGGGPVRWSVPLPLCILLLLSAVTPGYSQILGQPGFSGPILAVCTGGAGFNGVEQVYETSPSALTIQFTLLPSFGSNVQVQVLLDGTAVGPSVLLTPGQSITPITTGVVGTGFHTITYQPTFSTCTVLGHFSSAPASFPRRFLRFPPCPDGACSC